MDSFAFVIHPLDPKRDVARKYPRLARTLPTALIHLFSSFWPPVYISRVTGVRSGAEGNEIEGWLVACPLTARQMLRLPTWFVYSKIVQTGRLAQELGARILGLGAFASVVGDAGETIARRLNLPTTTGHSLTVSTAVEALERRARGRGIELGQSTAAVVGATGSIGSACAELLSTKVGNLILVSQQEHRLGKTREKAQVAGTCQVQTTTQLDDIRGAQLVLSATSAARPVIQPEHLGRDAIVCDVALPPDVSPSVGAKRDDVQVIAGGVVDVPKGVDFGFNFGLPPGKTYACMAETMILALERRYESFTVGKQIRIERVQEITHLARKHGFVPSTDDWQPSATSQQEEGICPKAEC